MISLQFSTGIHPVHHKLFLPYLYFNGSSSSMAWTLQPFPADTSTFWPQFGRKQSAANDFSMSEAPDKVLQMERWATEHYVNPLFKRRKRKESSQLSYPFWYCQTLLCRIHLLPEVMIKIYYSVSSDGTVKKSSWYITEDILSSCQPGFLYSWALLHTQPLCCSHA